MQAEVSDRLVGDPKHTRALKQALNCTLSAGVRGDGCLAWYQRQHSSLGDEVGGGQAPQGRTARAANGERKGIRTTSREGGRLVKRTRETSRDLHFEEDKKVLSGGREEEVGRAGVW